MGISSRSRKRRRIEIAIIVIAIFLVSYATAIQDASAAPTFIVTSIPSSAQAGQTIPVFANVTSGNSEMEVYITFKNPANGSYNYVMMAQNGANGTWSYNIPAQPWKGSLEVLLTAKDGTGVAQYPSSGFMTIGIAGDEQPKPFPWNIVVILIFLGVVLVLTELTFKPGFYRKTGRERARELEEQDRMREAAEDKDKGKAPDNQGPMAEKPR